jgi:hypothetical protein
MVECDLCVRDDGAAIRYRFDLLAPRVDLQAPLSNVAIRTDPHASCVLSHPRAQSGTTRLYEVTALQGIVSNVVF